MKGILAFVHVFDAFLVFGIYGFLVEITIAILHMVDAKSIQKSLYQTLKVICKMDDRDLVVLEEYHWRKGVELLKIRNYLWSDCGIAQRREHLRGALRVTDVGDLGNPCGSLDVLKIRRNIVLAHLHETELPKLFAFNRQSFVGSGEFIPS